MSSMKCRRWSVVDEVSSMKCRDIVWKKKNKLVTLTVKWSFTSTLLSQGTRHVVPQNTKQNTFFTIRGGSVIVMYIRIFVTNISYVTFTDFKKGSKMLSSSRHLFNFFQKGCDEFFSALTFRKIQTQNTCYIFFDHSFRKVTQYVRWENASYNF